jgi:hypothetical protein
MIVKKRGGPKTTEGKAVSSKNSTKHGLTAQTTSSTKEKEIVSGYIQELTNYYKPESPLEKIQIERIAICKAKLDRLYEVEQLQLALVMEKFIQDPSQILDQLPMAKGAVKGMVNELIQHGEITLPCKLKLKDLKIICEETIYHRKNVLKETDLEVNWPNLTKFLESYEPIYLADANCKPLEKLALISEGIEHSLDHQDKYLERYQDLIEIALRLKEQSESESQANSLDDDLEIDKLIEERNAAREAQRQKRYPNNKEPELVIPQEPLIDQEKLTKQLKSFVNLFRTHNLSLEVYKQYQSMKELMVQGVVLPQRESDLFMRYQTTLDRRLSTAIGELLHLQSKRTSS